MMSRRRKKLTLVRIASERRLFYLEQPTSNKYLLHVHDTLPVMFAAGRIVVTLFAITLGHNLAHSSEARYGRAAVRLARGLRSGIPTAIINTSVP